jgi:hypothetical protein
VFLLQVLYLFYHLVPSLLCLIWWLDLLAWNLGL